MKQALILVLVALLVPAPTYTQKADLSKRLSLLEQELQQTIEESKKVSTTVTVKGDAVEINTSDLNETKDAAFEQAARHRGKQLRVFVAPLPRPQAGWRIKLSKAETLMEAFMRAEENLKKELEAAGKNVSATLPDRLTQYEEYLELDKVNPQDLSLIERSYRICWVEELGRQNKEIEVTFQERK